EGSCLRTAHPNGWRAGICRRPWWWQGWQRQHVWSFGRLWGRSELASWAWWFVRLRAAEGDGGAARNYADQLGEALGRNQPAGRRGAHPGSVAIRSNADRSEERRVGKECRSRW